MKLLCCVQLPATALHDVSTSSITLHNTTAEPQTFEFSVPPSSDLTLSPHVATIPAQGSLCVALRYSPQPTALPESNLQPDAPTTSVAGTASGTASRGFQEQRSSVCMVPDFCNVPKWGLWGQGGGGIQQLLMHGVRTVGSGVLWQPVCPTRQQICSIWCTTHSFAYAHAAAAETILDVAQCIVGQACCIGR